MLLAAGVTNPVDNQPVAGHVEVLITGDRIADTFELVTLKLDQLITDGAVQVIMLWIAIVVLIDPSSAEYHPSQQARLNQFVQRPVDRGPTDFSACFLLGQIINQFFGIKMVVPLKDMLDQHLPLLRDPLPFTLQILGKPLLRRAGHLNGRERKITGHR